MRPFTICYGLMTLTLGSMAALAIANAESLRSPFGDSRVFAMNAAAESQPTVILPSKSEPANTSVSDGCNDAAKDSTDASTSTSISPELIAGMNADQVRSTLGEPDSISANGARWQYGSSILIFSDERLAGHVQYDPVQAAMNKFNHAMLAAQAHERRADRSAKSDGPKVLTAMNRTPRSHSRYLNRPIAAGSSRQAFRYDRNRNEYSYYMNRHGPLDRMYSGKRFLPRGMTTSTERNLGQQYLNYGASRYSVSPSTQYRR